LRSTRACADATRPLEASGTPRTNSADDTPWGPRWKAMGARGAERVAGRNGADQRLNGRRGVLGPAACRDARSRRRGVRMAEQGKWQERARDGGAGREEKWMWRPGAYGAGPADRRNACEDAGEPGTREEGDQGGGTGGGGTDGGEVRRRRGGRERREGGGEPGYSGHGGRAPGECGGVRAGGHGGGPRRRATGQSTEGYGGRR
jgi:hypothetical protein